MIYVYYITQITIINLGVITMNTEDLPTSLDIGNPFFYDLNEDSFIQVSRDYFDDVRLYLVKGEIVRRVLIKYSEFKSDTIKDFISTLDF